MSDQGGPMGDAEYLALLETFFLPLTPEEAAEHRRVYTETGVFTKEMIIRILGGEAAPEGT